jgi:hypothetical protein
MMEIRSNWGVLATSTRRTLLGWGLSWSLGVKGVQTKVLLLLSLFKEEEEEEEPPTELGNEVALLVRMLLVVREWVAFVFRSVTERSGDRLGENVPVMLPFDGVRVGLTVTEGLGVAEGLLTDAVWVAEAVEVGIGVTEWLDEGVLVGIGVRVVVPVLLFVPVEPAVSVVVLVRVRQPTTLTANAGAV